MTRNVSSPRSIEQTQTGQATFEFVLAVLFIIITLSALYQALHFELDVFNKISLLRYRIMDEAHRKQAEDAKSFPSEPMDFRPLVQLTPVLLMTQDVTDPTLQYGPKSFRYRIGTKFAEPPPIQFLPENHWLIAGAIQLAGDYNEDGGRFRNLFGPTSPVWVPLYPDLGDQ